MSGSTDRENGKSECCGGGNCGGTNSGGTRNAVSRRTFLGTAGAGAATFSLLGGVSQGMAMVKRSDAEAADHFVPEDKQLRREWLDLLTAKGEQKVFRDQELKTIGMPCGGVAAGQLYLCGDGSLGYWWIFNNYYNTGYGMSNKIQTWHGMYPVVYWPEPFSPPQPVDQGFALRVGGKAYQLNRHDFDAIEFIGEYPVGTVRYRDSSKQLPVEVELEAFSPFLPLDAEASATPATILQYTVRNTSDREQQVDLAGWLQNPVMLTHQHTWQALCENRKVKKNKLTGIDMTVVPGKFETPAEGRRETVFDDFENGYDNWTVEGDAFGEGPAEGTLPGQNRVSGYQGKKLVNSFRGNNDRLRGKMTSKAFTVTEPYIVFRLGGGHLPGKACMNLLVGGKVVRSVTGDNSEKLLRQCWNVREFAGKEAQLQIVDDAGFTWAHILVDDIMFTNYVPEDASGFDPKHQYMGSLALNALGADAWVHPALSSREEFLRRFAGEGAAVAEQSEKVATHPLGEKQVACVGRSLTLKPGESHTFNFVLSWYAPNRGHYDATWGLPKGFGPRVGNRYNLWYKNAVDVAEKLHSRFDELVSTTKLFRDTLYDTSLPYWLTQRLSMTMANLATESCYWEEDGLFYGWEGVGCCSGNCGHVWNYAHGMAWLLPELERSVRELQDWNPKKGFDPETGKISFRGNFRRSNWAGDSQPGYVLKGYREHLLTENDDFLKRNWKEIRKSLQFLINLDGNADGLIESVQHNTYDINFHGATPLTTTIYLAALRAGEKMARHLGENDFAEEVKSIYEKGAKLAVERMFNGEYLIQDKEALVQHSKQTGDGCLADQIFGQTWAYLLDLGEVYDHEVIDSCLRSIWKYNWTPDVGPQNKVHPPERDYAYPGEAGLFICTWPKSKHPGERGVRYRDEVWTGIEYQVAHSMICNGMLTEGLAVIRAAHERYDAVKRNPWNEVECGDHYVRALASWGCLLALMGYHYDGPAGILRFNPLMNADDFRGYFNGAAGWGSFAQQRNGQQQTDEIALKWGKLKLQTLSFGLPEGKSAKQVKVTLGDKTLPAKVEQVESFARITLKSPVTVKAGQTLSAQINLA